ncbi:hypothetical protein POTOM_026263 [Populus tomentosa]|uniref:Uncharacterized protein n=1 Tax=Populus tomentosa TaxID=118781 RepID=A0A8X7ZGP6_POPTO|nr:hypothetical protein POTOM_026263 [Populus tomentosa]
MLQITSLGNLPSQLIADEMEKNQSCSFVYAGIAFCKLEHLVLTIPVKNQAVELIVAIHDLLAEHGLCRAGEGGEGEEGTFLKFAIKHPLPLDMKLKSNLNSSNIEAIQHDEELYCPNKTSKVEPISNTLGVEMGAAEMDEIRLENDIASVECRSGDEGKNKGDKPIQCIDELNEGEREELELLINNALDQCFFCLYGLNIRFDSSNDDDDLATHKNTSRGDYQIKEQYCADVFQYLLPSAKASSVSILSVNFICICICASLSDLFNYCQGVCT